MRYTDVTDKVSNELGLPKDLVANTYRAYWKFIRDSIEKLPLKKKLSPEEFASLRTNINIPSLGKLNCTYDRYIGVKSRYSITNKIRNRK